MENLSKKYNLPIHCPVCERLIRIYTSDIQSLGGCDCVVAECVDCEIKEVYTITQSDYYAPRQIWAMMKVVDRFISSAVRVRLFYLNLNKEWRLCSNCRKTHASVIDTNMTGRRLCSACWSELSGTAVEDDVDEPRNR